MYDYRSDRCLLYSGVSVGPEQIRYRIVTEPGRILPLFTFLCEEIPGMCVWSSFIRVRSSFPKDAPGSGTGRIMMCSDNSHTCRHVPGILRGKRLSRIQPCRRDRTGCSTGQDVKSCREHDMCKSNHDFSQVHLAFLL